MKNYIGKIIEDRNSKMFIVRKIIKKELQRDKRM